MKPLLFVFAISLLSTATFPQQVTVTATTNQKEVERRLKTERETGRINRAFFAEDDRCRAFLKAKEWIKAESSCKLAISLAEKLPVNRLLERSGARVSLGIALLLQQRQKEAIPLFNRAVEIRETYSSEPDADTADILSFLGHAYRLSNDIQSARAYYEKAERTYRAAFVSIGVESDEIRFSYPGRLRDTLRAHYDMLRSVGLVAEAEVVRVRLVEVEKEFAKYLSD
ncbi:MAG: tetratricopeptide repeat protein [Pyrinomonadaceae bacterium]